jgi:hypothetical protein
MRRALIPPFLLLRQAGESKNRSHTGMCSENQSTLKETDALLEFFPLGILIVLTLSVDKILLHYEYHTLCCNNRCFASVYTLVGKSGIECITKRMSPES